MYRDHRKGPGGPPGGATYPGGPHGLKWVGNQPLVGWCTPPWASPAPRVGNPGGGGAPHLAWGASHPPWPPPPLEMGSPRGPAPPWPLYKEWGREGSRTLALGASLFLYNTSPSRSAWRSLAEIAAASTTTPSCCWISINFSSPLAGSRRRRRGCSVRVLNAEVPSVRR